MRKFFVWTAIIVGVVLAVGSLGILATWFGSGYGKSSAEANAQYADWKKNGLPVRQGDLTPTPAAPGDNAFEDLRQLRIEFFGGEMKTGLLPKNITSDAGKKDGSTNRYLLERQGGLNKLAAILEAKKSYQSDKDWDLGASVLFPEFSQYKDWTRLLCLDAERRAAEGDLNGAAARFRTARQLNRLTAMENLAIANLVALAQEQILIESLNKIASQHPQSLEFLLSAKKMLAETTWKMDQAETARKEAYMMLAIYRNVPQNYIGRLDEPEAFPEPAAGGLIRDGVPQNRFSRAVSAEFMRYYNQFYPRIVKDPTDPTIITDSNHEIYRMQASRSFAEKDVSWMLPPFDYLRSGNNLLATQRAANAYLDVLIYHARHQTWPTTLKQAGVDGVNAIDPITGVPLGYRVKPQDVRVWHAGTDWRDSGGITQEEAKAAGRGGERDFVLAHPPRK